MLIPEAAICSANSLPIPDAAPVTSAQGSNFRYKLLILHRIIAFPDSQNHFKPFQIISKSNNRAELARPFLSSATCDRIRSWLTAQGQILSSLGSSLAKNHDKEKDPGFIPAPFYQGERRTPSGRTSTVNAGSACPSFGPLRPCIALARSVPFLNDPTDTLSVLFYSTQF